MGYRTLAECVADLDRAKHWSGSTPRSTRTWKPPRSSAASTRRAGRRCSSRASKGCRFPMVGNLFGTLERAAVPLPRHARGGPPARRAEGRSGDRCCKRPWRYRGRAVHGAHACCRTASSRGPILAHTTIGIAELPQLKSWPDDGGAFVTLPQVYTEDPDRPGWRSRTSACTACSSRATVRARPRGRPALPDPPRHRRAPRGGASAGASRSA